VLAAQADSKTLAMQLINPKRFMRNPAFSTFRV
jgi:hypothetical protein